MQTPSNRAFSSSLLPVHLLHTVATVTMDKSASTPVPRAAYLVALLYSIRSLVQYGSQHRDAATFALIPRERGAFVDLAQLTFSAECEATAEQLLRGERMCDPFRRPFNYTPFSLEALRGFHVVGADCLSLGVVFGFITILALTAFLLTTVRDRRIAWVAAALALISFPLQLGMERANTDLVVWAACLGFVALSMQSMPAGRGLAGFFGLFAAALKFFPAAGFALWTVTAKKLDRTRAILFIPAAIAIGLQASSISYILKNTPKPQGGVSFGLMCTFADLFDPKWSPALIALKVVLFGIALWRASLWLKKSPEHALPIDPAASAFFQCFGWMFVATYVAGRSWDYRLVLLLGLLPLLLNWMVGRNGAGRLLPKTMLGLLAFVLFEQYALALGSVGTALHVASDLLVQPILMGTVVLVLISLALTKEAEPAAQS